MLFLIYIFINKIIDKIFKILNKNNQILNKIFENKKRKNFIKQKKYYKKISINLLKILNDLKFNIEIKFYSKNEEYKSIV